MSDHRLPERVQLHARLAAPLPAALVVEKAGGEVDLGAADAQHRHELDEGHPALTARRRVRDYTDL